MRNHRDYLAEYPASGRAFLALLRRIGARMIASLDLPRPILNLGCGDGQSQHGASHVFDLDHYYSVPTLIYKKPVGRWILAPWRANFILIEPILRRWYDESPTGESAYLYFMCERK